MEHCVLVIYDEDEGYFPTYQPGYWLTLNDVDELIDGLIAYKEAYSDEEITEINRQKTDEWFSSMSQPKQFNKNKNKYGYVYIFKCADKYKVGYSKHVEQRIKQLDTRPFKLELVFKCYSERAYDIEQEVHSRLEAYKITNEWYDNISVDFIIDTIKEVAEDLKCDIQF